MSKNCHLPGDRRMGFAALQIAGFLFRIPGNAVGLAFETSR